MNAIGYQILSKVSAMRAEHPGMSWEAAFEEAEQQNWGLFQGASVRIDAEEQSARAEESTDSSDSGMLAEFPLGDLACPVRMGEFLSRLHQKAARTVRGVDYQIR